ncbi:MAG TPA: SpoIIE family protein phosphatase [Gammaproteobacteria bacterium]|nr:SpoIIE family protein phosphatase [Gammaproteobacteria bacterium]
MQNQPDLPSEALVRILDVTRKLAAPFDLIGMLTEVVEAGKSMLGTERGRLWLYEPKSHELVLSVPMIDPQVRVSADAGLMGKSLSTRQILNIPDCYANPYFNRAVDQLMDYRTRCMLILPLIGYDDSPVGVMQLLNKNAGVFDAGDELIAAVLAAQCAVAMQRAQMTEALLIKERLDKEVSVAREIQLSTLPTTMPHVEGYDTFGMVRPTAQTGGDTFDLVMLGNHLFMLLGDATGHGFGPALSATQLQAMLRVAFRLGADLDEAFTQVNNQLAEDLPDDRFVTAFMGFLDAETHRVSYHAGGQAPILHFHAVRSESELLGPTGMPMGVFELEAAAGGKSIDLAPGDILGLISDGVYEYANLQGEHFGEAGVAEIIRLHHDLPMSALADRLLREAVKFAGDAPQHDDITIVLVRRLPGTSAMQNYFGRSFGALDDIFAFTRHFFEHAAVPSSIRGAIDLSVEELFINIVKYNSVSVGDILITLKVINNCIEVSLTDFDAERFDSTATPEADIHAPLDKRSPGGLGLHLVRRMVDSLDYEYSNRQSTITFRKIMGKPHV